MTRPQFLALTGVLVLAVVVRIFCFATEPFFVDAGAIAGAVADGRMRIQFPGYVPFCLVLKGMTFLTGTPFASEILFGFWCGLASMFYVVRFAGDRGGFPGALVASVVAGFSAMMVYFSCVGASYAAELAAMSGMIYHGNRMLTKDEPGHYYGALGWYIFGSLMRTLSFPFTGLGLLYLLWKHPAQREIVATGVAFIAATLAYLGMSAAYFGSLHNLWASEIFTGAFQVWRPVWLALNWLRCALYPWWGLNLFLLLGAGVLWLSRRRLDRDLRTFFLLLTIPYVCVIAKYIPHAGYICLLLPALICAPWVAEQRFWLDTRPVAVALVLAPIFLAQVFLARPIATTGPVSLVANAYFLMYTRAGIKGGVNQTLKRLATQNHVMEKYIPLSRGDHSPGEY